MLQEKRLEQINYVIENSKHVKLNIDKLDEWVLLLENPSSWSHSWIKYKEVFTEEEIIMLSFILESMNFCFWKEPIFKYKNQIKSSAMMEMFIDKAISNKKLLDIKYLIEFRYKDLINIFGIEEGNLKKRYKSLMYTVNKIYNNKNFYKELFKIKSADKLCEFITSFDNFNDISIYKEKEIYFYKRATLLIKDLFYLSDTIHNNIKNIDSLLGCADYVIPKGLRSVGILEYDDELSQKIDNKKEIKENSEEEVEIRAYTLYVIEYVKNKLDNSINSTIWDNIIWQYFRNKEGIPHRTDTIFY